MAYTFSSRLTEEGLIDLSAYELADAVAGKPGAEALVSPALIQRIAAAIRQALKDQDDHGA